MRGLNLTATLKADGKSYAVLCLDFASDEVRLFNDENQTAFSVNLGGLLEKGYKKSREASFIAEELSELLRGDEPARDIDAYIDSVIFQIGALSKILKDENKVKRCFEAVLNANERKGEATDANGKIIKDKSVFIEPNEIIKAVLDE